MAAGPISSVMDAAERSQAMLDKNLATAVIVLLALLVIVLVRALVRTSNSRVEDAKAVTKGVLEYIQENTRSNFALARAVEAKLVRKPRVPESPPSPPAPTLPPGGKP